MSNSKINLKKSAETTHIHIRRIAVAGLLNKLMFFFCFDFWSSGFSPNKDSLEIGG